MEKEMVGTVIEKSFRPPLGAPDEKWCYLMVEINSEERIMIRLHKKYVDRVTIGDRIRFSKPRRKKQRTKDLEILEKGKL
jgi:hypothetical protein